MVRRRERSVVPFTTNAPQQTAPLFDHLVGARGQRQRGPSDQTEILLCHGSGDPGDRNSDRARIARYSCQHMLRGGKRRVRYMGEVQDSATRQIRFSGPVLRNRCFVLQRLLTSHQQRVIRGAYA